MDATCTIQDSIHVFSLVHKYVSRILGTYHIVTLFIKIYTLIPTYNLSHIVIILHMSCVDATGCHLIVSPDVKIS